jgi:hypothetical protein
VAPVVKKKKKKKKEAQSEEASNVASSGPAEDDQGNFCSICHALFNNPLMAKQHYEGKKHKKQLTQQKLMETYGPSTAPGSFFCKPRGVLLRKTIKMGGVEMEIFIYTEYTKH